MSRHKWRMRVLFLAAWLAVIPAPRAASVRLGWECARGDGIAGHVIHYGRVKGQYTEELDVGLTGCITNARTGRCACTNTISNLLAGVVYYFATTTYDTNGQPSAFSKEVSWPDLLPAANQPATLTAEGCTPVNGAVDPGESVTVDFAVQNVSAQNTLDLVGTLLPQGGVLSPSGPQTYGRVEAGGAPVSRPFTFTAAGSRGGTLLAAVHFEAGTNDYGVVEYPLSLGQPVTNSWSATNPAPIFISATDGTVSPYPSPIGVSGVGGTLSKVTLTLHDLSHTWFGDLQVLLVGPQGQAALVLSDVGGNYDATHVTLTLDDGALAPLPDAGPIESGSWQPTSHATNAALPAPSPSGPFESALRVFNGTNPNGTWRLFVADDYPTDDGGEILGGWSLAVTTTNSECCLPARGTDLGVTVRDSRDPVPLTNDYAYTIVVTNLGPLSATGVRLTNWLPPEVEFVSASSSQGSCSQAAGVVLCDLGSLDVFALATVTLLVNPRGGPTLTNTVVVTSDQPDFNPLNNLAAENTTTLVPTLSVFDASVIEGDGSLGPALFLVALSRPTFLTVQVDYQTISLSAEAGLDFLPQSNRLTFLPGEVSKMIEVPVLGDSLYEGDETLLVRLSGAVNATLARAEALGTIVDDDPIPAVSINDVTVVEGQSGRTNAVFTLSLSAPSGRPVTVSYRTTNGTAVAGSDFVPVWAESVTIPAQQTSALIAIAVNGDTEVEPDETFSVVLIQATNAVIAKGIGLGTILTDDFGPLLDLTGFRVVSENQTPVNGEVDPGETVTVSLAVRNNGTAPTTNLVVTLQPGGGIVAPSDPQTYGVVAANGGQVSRLFTFTAGIATCGRLQPVFGLKDGASDLGTATLRIVVGGGAELSIVSLGTNQSSVAEHGSLTDDDRGGIAVSASRVFVTGDGSTASFALTNLSGGVGLGERFDGLVSDLSTETVYALGYGDQPLASAEQTVTSLIELDGTTGGRTGRRIDLSTPLTTHAGSGVFAGYGRAVLWNGSHAYDIELPSGDVTDLGVVNLPRHQLSESWAFWGVAENSGETVNLVYVADSRTIVRTRVSDGATTTVGSFSNLSDMASFTISPRLGRWYFHHEGPSQFGGGTAQSEWVGYAEAATTVRCGNSLPVIQVPPHPVTVLTGGTARFSVGVSGRSPLQFQWRKDGTNLSGAVGSSLTVSNVQTGDLGDYAVGVANLYGSATSAVARLTLATPVRNLADDFEPDIDYPVWLEFGGQVAANPVGDRISGGNSLWFGGEGSRFATTVPVDASGGGTVSFWLREADGSSYSWGWVSLPDQGIVLECSTDLGSTWLNLGTYATFEFYRWTHVELPIPPSAETSPVLFRWRQLTNDGPCCAQWALDDVSITTLGTNDPPQITQQPADSVVSEGQTALLSVTVTGSRLLRYQWSKDGLDLPGATAATLVMTNVQISDGGDYRVAVTNAFGGAVSSVARLTVREPLFIGLFYDPHFVQVGDGPAAEATTLRASLGSLGYAAIAFTNLLTAAATYPVLVFPEQEVADLASVLSLDARAALSNFVWQGGLMIVHGSAGRAATLLNTVLGWSVGESTGAGPYFRTVQAGGTFFADDPSYLTDNNEVYTLFSPALPADALRLYTNGAQTAAALVPWGSGKAIYLGWDWNSAVPLGQQDGGWLSVLASAVLEHEPITNAPPVIIESPVSQTIARSRTAVFQVTAAGSRPLTYQWRKDGTNLAGAVSSALSVTNAQPLDAGAYTVEVTNLYGAVTSAVATLTVRDALEVAIFNDPSYVGASDAVAASLERLGFAVTTFTNIESATQTSLVLLFPKFGFGDPASGFSSAAQTALSNFVHTGGLVIIQGSTPGIALLNRAFGFALAAAEPRGPYSLAADAAATHFAGGLPTVPDNFTVLPLASDSLPPGSLAVYSQGGVAAVARLSQGAGKIVYLGWDWDDAVPLGSQDGGWLLALDSAVLEASQANAPPLVVVPPAAQAVAAGMDARFSVGVSGTPPFAYQWRNDGGSLAGATESVLRIPGAQVSDSGGYSVVVSNAFGVTTSTPAPLTVRAGLLVSVFDNPRYVDSRGGSGSEADAVQASLNYLGFIPGTFSDIAVAASECPILLFPKVEGADLASELSSSDQAALSNFVYFGGSMILHGGWSGHASSLLNRVFGFQVAESFGGDTIPLGSEAADTEFANDPSVLPALSYLYPFTSSTLPAGSLKIYATGADTAVARIPMGAGKILYLGWDWFNAVPLGTEDGGWLTVLESAVRESAVATNPAPGIVTQPASQVVAAGGPATFGVQARGRGLSYQWCRDGAVLPGANGPTLTLPGVQAGDVGAYSLVVSNAYGVVTSAEAALRLFTPGIDLYDDFEPGIDLAQWAGFGGEVAANGNGGSVSGGNALWFGGDGMRMALTRRLDTRRGGFIRFFLRLADGPGYPWEAPELPDEGVVLECSSDGGLAWTELARCDSTEFRAWRGVQVALPPAARSGTTQFRWRQLTHSGAGFDHWAIDDVWVNANSIPPRLRITRTASEVVLSWPVDWTGYRVQEADALVAPVAWTTLHPQPPAEVVEGQNVVRLPLGPAARFYQLSNP